MNQEQRREVRRFLRTGDSEPVFPPWPGSIIESCARARQDLLDALLAAVRRRCGERRAPPGPAGSEARRLVRARLQPMVCGLFPATEREAVLDLLQRSFVFLTADAVEQVIRDAGFLHTAWNLANIYLTSAGAKPLGRDTPGILGLSEGERCYVSAAYFQAGDRFADFVVHEAAHAFHNCKRGQAGLKETRAREWLLDIEFRKRETFAYACEVYSRLCELGRNRKERQALLDELAAEPGFLENCTDFEELIEMLRKALSERNGWKHIHERCRPARSRRS